MMSIQIEIAQEKKQFTSVLEAIHFLVSKQLDEDVERIQETKKSKEAYQTSVQNKHEGYSLDQAKEMVGNIQ